LGNDEIGQQPANARARLVNNFAADARQWYRAGMATLQSHENNRQGIEPRGTRP
jgi:hypothetical protein